MSKLRRHIGRTLLLAGAAATPFAVAWTIPLVANWSPALPEIFEPAGNPADIAEVLGNLSLSLTSLSIAFVVGAVALLRETRAPAPLLFARLAAGLVVAFTLVSAYSGYRFQLALAEQISMFGLDMPRIVDRLEWQGGATLAAFSMLFLLGVERLILTPPVADLPARRKAPRKPRTTRGA